MLSKQLLLYKTVSSTQFNIRDSELAVIFHVYIVDWNVKVSLFYLTFVEMGAGTFDKNSLNYRKLILYTTRHASFYVVGACSCVVVVAPTSR